MHWRVPVPSLFVSSEAPLIAETAADGIIGTDVLNRQLFAADWSFSMTPLVFDLNAVGVLRAWFKGTISNNGLNIWATSGTGYAAICSREYNGPHSQLILTIGLNADINGDGFVNIGDLQSLVASWGK